MSFSLPDANIWFALAHEEHTGRGRALEWWTRDSNPKAFCRLTQLALLRLLTTAAPMAGAPLTMREAWGVFDGVRQDPTVFWLEDSSAGDAIFRRITNTPEKSPKLWTDAYLLATAEATGATLVTMDRALASRAGNVLLV